MKTKIIFLSLAMCLFLILTPFSKAAIKLSNDFITYTSDTSGFNITNSTGGLLFNTSWKNILLDSTGLNSVYNLSSSQNYTVYFYDWTNQNWKIWSQEPRFPGEVGFWRFDEGSGTTTADSSGKGNTGTLINSPAWATGKFNYALNFSSTSSQYINIVNSNSLNLGATTDSYTISAWIDLTNSQCGATGTRLTVAHKRNGGSGAFPFVLWLGPNTTGTPNFQMFDGTNNPGIEGTTNVCDGNWHYVAGERDANRKIISIYVDGVLQGSTSDTTTTSMANTGNITVGAANGGTGYFFNGVIDNVKIYNRALSPDEILAEAQNKPNIPNWLDPRNKQEFKWRYSFVGNNLPSINYTYLITAQDPFVRVFVDSNATGSLTPALTSSAANITSNSNPFSLIGIYGKNHVSGQSGNYNFIVYQNGTNLFYVSSANMVNWSPAVALVTDMGNTNWNGYFYGNNFYFIYVRSSDSHVMYSKSTISGNTITPGTLGDLYTMSSGGIGPGGGNMPFIIGGDGYFYIGTGDKIWYNNTDVFTSLSSVIPSNMYYTGDWGRGSNFARYTWVNISSTAIYSVTMTSGTLGTIETVYSGSVNGGSLGAASDYTNNVFYFMWAKAISPYYLELSQRTASGWTTYDSTIPNFNAGGYGDMCMGTNKVYVFYNNGNYFVTFSGNSFSSAVNPFSESNVNGWTVSGNANYDGCVISWSEGAISPYTIKGASLTFTHNLTIPLSLGENRTSLTTAEPGLVGYWNFNEGSGTSAYDSSGNGNTGTLNSGATLVSNSSCKFGGCLIISSTGYVNAGNSSSLNINSSLTVATWVNFPSIDMTGSTYPVIQKRDVSNSPFPYDLSESGKALFQIFDGTNNPQVSSTTSLNDSTWHFVVGVRDTVAGKLYVYVDGVQQGTTTDTATGSITTVGNVTICSRNSGTSQTCNGNQKIDEVRIYNRALNASEIQQLYQTGLNQQKPGIYFTTNGGRNTEEVLFATTNERNVYRNLVGANSPQIVQQASNSCASCSSFTVTFSNSVTGGDTIVIPIWVNSYPTYSLSSVTDSLGSLYMTNRQGGPGMYIAYAQVPSTGMDTITITVNGGTTINTAWAFDLRGYQPILDSSSSGSGTSSTPSVTSFTPSANSIVFGLLGASGQTISAGTGYTLASGGTLQTFFAAEYAQRVSGAQTVPFSLSASGNWNEGAWAFAPSPVPSYLNITNYPAGNLNSFNISYLFNPTTNNNLMFTLGDAGRINTANFTSLNQTGFSNETLESFSKDTQILTRKEIDQSLLNKIFHTSFVDNMRTFDWCLKAFSSDQIGHFNAKANAKYGTSFGCGAIDSAPSENMLNWSNGMKSISSFKNLNTTPISSGDNLLFSTISSIFLPSSKNKYSGDTNSNLARNLFNKNISKTSPLVSRPDTTLLASTTSNNSNHFLRDCLNLFANALSTFSDNSLTSDSVSLDFDTTVFNSRNRENSLLTSLLTNKDHSLPEICLNSSFNSSGTGITTSAITTFNTLVDFGYLNVSNYPDCNSLDYQNNVICSDDGKLYLVKWKYFPELKPTDEAITLNEKGTIEWHNPQRLTYYNYSGQAYRIVGENGLDLLVSPNHKLYVATNYFSIISNPSSSTMNSLPLNSLTSDKSDDNTLTSFSATGGWILKNIMPPKSLGGNSDVFAKSESLVSKTNFFSFASKTSLPLLTPLAAYSAENPSESRNSFTSTRTFSSSRNFGEFDIAFSADNFGSISQSFSNHSPAQARVALNNSFDRLAGRNKLYDIAYQNSSSLEGRLAVANLAVSNNVVANLDSHNIKTSEEVFKDLENDFVLEFVEDVYQKYQENSNAAIYFLDSNNQPVKITSITLENYSDFVYDTTVKNHIILVRRNFGGNNFSLPVWSGNSLANSTLTYYDLRDDSLVGWWKFNEGSGSVAGDNAGVGVGSNGNLFGTYTWITNSSCKSGLGSCINFDGSSAYVNVSNTSAAVSAIQNNQPFTVSAWVRPNTLSGLQYIVAHEGSGGGYILGAGTFQGVSNRGAFCTSAGCASPTGVITSSALSTGAWYLLTGVWDGANIKIYVNGILSNSTSLTTSTVTPTSPLINLTIGKDSDIGGTNYVNGMVDNVKIYRRALSTDEVLADYLATSDAYPNWQKADGNTTVPTATPSFNYDGGAAGIWHFDEGAGANVTDASGNGNTGTVNATWITNSSCKFGSCLSFDGVGNYVDIPDSSSISITNQISIETWVYIRNQHTGYIVDKNFDKYYLLVYSDGRINGNNAIRQGYSGFIGKWTHLITTVDSSGNSKLYADGQLIATGTFSLTTSSNPLSIGRQGAGFPCCWFNGLIDEIRIYSRALTDQEVWEHYARQVSKYYDDFGTAAGGKTYRYFGVEDSNTSMEPITPASTVLHLRFDDNSTVNVTDSSGLGNNGRVNGTVAWVTNSSCQTNFGGCMIFDGSTTNYIDMGNPSTINLNNSFSWGGWFNANGFAGNKTIIGKGNSNYVATVKSDGQVFCAIGDTSGSVVNVAASDKNYSSSGWHQIFCERNAGNLLLYADGSLKTNVSDTAGTITGTSSLQIGATKINPSVVQSTSSATSGCWGTGSTTCNVSFGSNVANGDMVIVEIQWDSTYTISSVTDSLSTSYTISSAASQTECSSTQRNTAMAYGQLSSSGSNNVTVTLSSGSFAGGGIIIYEVSGLVKTGATFFSGNGTGSTVQTSSSASYQSGYFLDATVRGHAACDTPGWSVGSGFTVGGWNSGSCNVPCDEYQIPSGSGSTQFPFSHSGILQGWTETALMMQPATNVAQPMNGTLDEVLIVNRSLTSDEVYQLYLGGYNRTINNHTHRVSAADGIYSDAYNLTAKNNTNFTQDYDMRYLSINGSTTTPGNASRCYTPSNISSYFSCSYANSNFAGLIYSGSSNQFASTCFTNSTSDYTLNLTSNTLQKLIIPLASGTCANLLNSYYLVTSYGQPTTSFSSYSGLSSQFVNLELKLNYQNIVITGDGNSIGRGVSKMCIENTGVSNNLPVINIRRC